MFCKRRAISMARLWCAIIVFVAGFSLLIVNATSPAELVKRNAQPDKQNKGRFQEAMVDEEYRGKEFSKAFEMISMIDH